MKSNIEFKDFQAPESVRKLIDRRTSKLEKNLRKFSPELVYLRLMVEQNTVRSLYTISITLDLPGTTLAAREEQHDVQDGIRRAFSELERQLDRYKANLRLEHWKRPARREEARQMKAAATSSVAAESKRDTFFSLVSPHLNRLQHFGRHLIAYAEAMGDLVEGDMI